MVKFIISVPNMKLSELKRFVAENMPLPNELMRRGRIARLPEICRMGGDSLTLEQMCFRFDTIPTEDATLKFVDENPPKDPVKVIIMAFGKCSEIKEGVCKIVSDHLRRALAGAGREHRVETVNSANG